MKKRITSFSAGFLTAVLLLALSATALAAGGKVSYNFANVALDGETKNAAGADITAANGQKVPGTILFTDAAGGKTNYLPIRAVSELLGVEIGYDSATKTILLGGQPAGKTAEPASTAETVSGRQWRRELGGEDGGIHYTRPSPKEVRDYDAPPTLRPTWLPEGYLLLGAGVGRGGVRNDSVTWSYVKDETSGSKITFTCYRPTNRSRGSNFGVGLDTAVLRCDARVQGRPADFYQIYDDGTCNILVWEDAAGNLFWLQGTQDQATCERIAESVRDVKDDPLPALTFGWIPEGFTLDTEGGLTMPAIVEETWAKKTQGPPTSTDMFYWTYSREALFGPRSTQPESVKVNGVQAQYWPGDLDARSNTASVSGTVTAVSTSADQLGPLLWTDPETEIHFCLEAPFDRDTMIRMAESISPK
ncbi:hypothetical protein [Oscillibacter sp. 1-3]|uniref:hypothetical protein n=1 Tax=Oscillibacter sp. 1-3 TaxID=1235797 RepID=UPI00033F1750|nr:hypothetical protein [Oscillibacter sp. 1-3]EOS66834.1 hypothetical protein C816_00980 [Oscillibacter sp. 1-3]